MFESINAAQARDIEMELRIVGMLRYLFTENLRLSKHKTLRVHITLSYRPSHGSISLSLSQISVLYAMVEPVFIELDLLQYCSLHIKLARLGKIKNPYDGVGQLNLHLMSIGKITILQILPMPLKRL